MFFNNTSQTFLLALIRSKSTNQINVEKGDEYLVKNGLDLLETARTTGKVTHKPGKKHGTKK